MLGLEIAVAIGLAVLIGGVIARWLRQSAPIVLMLVGLAVSALPDLGGVGLPHDVVLLLFLPPLLYWESLTTSLREMRRFVRGIVLTGTLLVMVTAALVAVVAHALGLSWATAWILGAALAPTDATTVASLGRVLPRGSLTVLRAESLINDGTGLVIYGLALAYATTGEVPSLWGVGWSLVVSFGGGTLIGLVLGWAALAVRRRLDDPVLHNVLIVLIPFTAYLIAEEVHASGVVAVVTVGLFMAREAPRFVPASVRAHSTPFWTIATYLLNGALFVLIGMQLPSSISALSGADLGRGVLIVGAVYLTVIGGRWLFLNISIALIRALDRRPQQRMLRTTARQRVVNTLAGYRGAVSLAVALSVPSGVAGADGTARDMVVFVTAGVVVATLVVQGLLLPRVISWAALPQDTEDQETETANATAGEAALRALPTLAAQLGTDPEVVEAVRREWVVRSAVQSSDADVEVVRRHEQHAALRLALLGVKRDAVVRLRDEGVIDDTVLRRVQGRLDLEELRLQDPPDAE